MTTLLAINRRARHGDIDPGEIVRVLSQVGPVEVHDLVSGPPLNDVVASHPQDLDRVVVAGGDGTLNRCLDTLYRTGLPVGVVPLGTANDFARSLEVPLDVHGALRVILEGVTRRISLGRVNGYLFLNAASIGVGSELNKSLNAKRKKRLGVLAYPATLLQLLGGDWRRAAIVTLDGRRKKARFMQITIVNGVHYGGGLTIDRDADLDDGLIRVLCLHPRSFRDMLVQAVTLRRGASAVGDNRHGVRLYTASRVTVTTRQKIDVSADGELLTSTPVECDCIPEAIEVYATPTCRTTDAGDRAWYGADGDRAGISRTEGAIPR